MSVACGREDIDSPSLILQQAKEHHWHFHCKSSQGLRTSIWAPRKSWSLRVATAIPRTRATAAIWQSAGEMGRTGGASHGSDFCIGALRRCQTAACVLQTFVQRHGWPPPQAPNGVCPQGRYAIPVRISASVTAVTNRSRVGALSVPKRTSGWEGVIHQLGNDVGVQYEPHRRLIETAVARAEASPALHHQRSGGPSSCCTASLRIARASSSMERSCPTARLWRRVTVSSSRLRTMMPVLPVLPQGFIGSDCNSRLRRTQRHSP